MFLQASGNNVIGQVFKLEKPKGSLLLVTEEPKNYEIIVVLSKGLGLKREDGSHESLDCEIGDIVIVSRSHLKEIKFEEESFLVFKQDSILAFVMQK